MSLADLIRKGPKPRTAPKLKAAGHTDNQGVPWPDTWPDGWCLIESDVLAERVLWIKDDAVNPPVHLQSVPIYTWAEIQQLIADTADADTLRTVHAVKTILGAHVIVGRGVHDLRPTPFQKVK